MSNFQLVFFDNKSNYFFEENIIATTINKLKNYYYKNKAIQVSNKVLLIGLSSQQVNAYPNILSFIYDIFSSEEEKRQVEIRDSIKIFIIPIELSSIENHIVIYKNEIEYIKNLIN